MNIEFQKSYLYKHGFDLNEFVTNHQTIYRVIEEYKDDRLTKQQRLELLNRDFELDVSIDDQTVIWSLYARQTETTEQRDTRVKGATEHNQKLAHTLNKSINDVYNEVKSHFSTM